MNAHLSMLDVIQAGPRERSKPCPFCGADAPLASMAMNGRYCVGCDNDDCAAQPYVSGATLTEVWQRWNSRT